MTKTKNVLNLQAVDLEALADGDAQGKELSSHVQSCCKVKEIIPLDLTLFKRCLTINRYSGKKKSKFSVSQKNEMFGFHHHSLIFPMLLVILKR